jgi:hypothetical protein
MDRKPFNNLIMEKFQPKYVAFKDPKSRIEILTFLVNNGVNIPAAIIENDTEIQNENSWRYFDILAIINWDLANKKITEYLEKTRDIKGLLLRLPMYWKKLGAQKLKPALRKWTEFKLNKEDLELLNGMILHLTGEATVTPEIDERERRFFDSVNYTQSFNERASVH